LSAAPHVVQNAWPGAYAFWQYGHAAEGVLLRSGMAVMGESGRVVG
jgi:hypothetical protein